MASITQAARTTGISRDTIYRLYKAGFIVGDQSSPKKIRIDMGSLQTHRSESLKEGFWTPKRRTRYLTGIADTSDHLGHRPGIATISTLLADVGGRKSFHSSGTANLNVQKLIEAFNEGFPVEYFDQLKELTGFSRNALAEAVQISERTIARRKVFEADESERIYRVGAVFQRAVEVLGSLSEARRWFTAAQKGLGGATPLDYCRTDLGAREVEDLLGRLEHGVFS